MAPKKGKSKGKKKQDTTAKAEEMRLIQLREQENIAEEEQRTENEKRNNNELSERIILWKEEQLTQQRYKDKQIDKLHKQLEEATAKSNNENAVFTAKLEELSLENKSLKSEISLLREENSEKELLRAREREGHIAQIEKARSEYENNNRKLEEANKTIQAQLHSNLLKIQKVEEEKVTIELENKEVSSKYEEQFTELKRELETALSMNKHLQLAVEEHEIDDKKNVTIMQMLNTQLEEERRHHANMMEEEKMKSNRLWNEFHELESRYNDVQQKLSDANSDINEMKSKTEVQIREYEEKMEQIKFDSQYLHNEVQSMKLESDTNAKIAEELRQTSTRDRENILLELECQQKRVEEMETILYRKEQEYCDKLTFMNAQLVNSRSTISQLQQKLEAERIAHDEELQRQLKQVEHALNSINKMQINQTRNDSEFKKRKEKYEADILSLKEEVKILKNNIVVAEQTNAKVLAEKNDEMQRLHELLDANFIPHRKEIEVARSSAKLDEVTLLRDKLHDAEKELRIKEAAYLETEQWWKAQYELKNEMIEELQRDLRKNELQRLSECQRYEQEIACLRKTLDIHFIPYTV